MTYAKTGTARGSRRSGALSLPPSPCPLCLCGGTSYGNGLGIANFINHRDTENTETRARSLRQRLCFGRSDPSHGAEVEREERKWSVPASERQSVRSRSVRKWKSKSPVGGCGDPFILPIRDVRGIRGQSTACPKNVTNVTLR